jgi:thiol-disulfide isomerase/thioredoxin
VSNPGIPRWASTAVLFAALVAGGAARAAGPAAPTAAAPPSVVAAELPVVRQAIRAPGARAVLVNVWATWCDACRDEMPDIVRLHRENRARGLRLVLISADDEQDREKAARFLGSLGVDFPSWLKVGDDMAFIDGLDRRWTGALPASFLFDGKGRVQRFWQGEVSAATLERAVAEMLRDDKEPGKKPDKQPERKSR